MALPESAKTVNGVLFCVRACQITDESKACRAVSQRTKSTSQPVAIELNRVYSMKRQCKTVTGTFFLLGLLAATDSLHGYIYIYSYLLLNRLQNLSTLQYLSSCTPLQIYALSKCRTYNTFVVTVVPKAIELAFL